MEIADFLRLAGKPVTAKMITNQCNLLLEKDTKEIKKKYEHSVNCATNANFEDCGRSDCTCKTTPSTEHKELEIEQIKDIELCGTNSNSIVVLTDRLNSLIDWSHQVNKIIKSK